MGLDIYVGSLSRYYAREWETVTQTYAKQQGMDYQTLYTGGEPQKVSQEEVRAQVLGWAEAIKSSVPVPIAFEWDESPEAPYFTDKPDWLGFSSLLLWAAYTEHPDLKVPERCVEHWYDDEAFNRCLAEDFKSEYGSLLRANLWVPDDFPFTFEATDIVGHDVSIGSITKLGSELIALNDKTWQADAQTITQWFNDGIGDDTSLEKAAQFGFAVVLDLANKAIENKLIMKLDS